MHTDASGYATGAAYLCGGLLGGSVAGYLGDTIAHRRKDGRLRCAAALALAGVPIGCVGILLPAGSLKLAMVALALTYAALSSYYGLVYSSIHDIIAPSQRAWVMTGFRVRVDPAVPASAGRDSDDR